MRSTEPGSFIYRSVTRAAEILGAEIGEAKGGLCCIPCCATCRVPPPQLDGEFGLGTS